MSPVILISVLLGVVFIFLLAQGLFSLYRSMDERGQEGVSRRLDAFAGQEATYDNLFIQDEEDETAARLGTFGASLAESLLMADSSLSVGALLVRCALLSLMGLVGGLMFMGQMGIVAGAVGILPIMLVRRQATKRAQSLVEQLPDGLELMSRSLQAGLGLNDAFRLVSEEMPPPLAVEFGRVFEEVRFGRDYRDAFGDMLTRNPSVFDLRLMVSSVLLQRETGGNLIEILENIAETIRARFLFQAKVKAMTGEARISASILGGLPLMVVCALAVINPGYLAPLRDHPWGRMILLGCGVMYLIAIVLMRDLSRVEV